jgi:hypothetical protein
MMLVAAYTIENDDDDDGNDDDDDGNDDDDDGNDDDDDGNDDDDDGNDDGNDDAPRCLKSRSTCAGRDNSSGRCPIWVW